jgi:hypothetical protein
MLILTLIHWYRLNTQANYLKQKIKRLFHFEYNQSEITKFYFIQGVSEFDRQTCRADSMIKNKHKTLNTCGVKNA